ncbi:MAG TPA: 6-hydroxymethylpterin diphosphokinase MptE-like protein [Nitrospirota bacterium]|nr:6-hydroxymethylpterin diphosphokinase MptE-like protein [Nitrospirota bacterium]
MTFENILRKNKGLRNAHAGKRCFIIGNGPSLNVQDLTLLENEISIAVNLFFSHPKANKVAPPYWVMADPLYWENPDVWFYPAFNAAIKAECCTKLLVPTGGIPFFLSINTGPLIDLHFFKFDATKDHTSIIDFTQGIPPYGQNVVIVCLMLAFYLGCNPIYFIGCDYDFARMSKEEYLKNKFNHFYGEDIVPTDHQYMAWEQWKRCIARMDYEYEQLNKYAAMWGFNVFNATKGGFLETFPRVVYEDLFALNMPPYTTAGENQGARFLGERAIQLMNSGDNQAALVLIDEALRTNINRQIRAEGLEYLKALCLARLNRFSEALICARQDFSCNPSNRDKSDVLIRQLLQEGVNCGLLK